MKVYIVTKDCDGFTRNLFAFSFRGFAQEFIDVQGDRYDDGVFYDIIKFDLHDELSINFNPSDEEH